MNGSLPRKPHLIIVGPFVRSFVRETRTIRKKKEREGEGEERRVVLLI